MIEKFDDSRKWVMVSFFVFFMSDPAKLQNQLFSGGVVSRCWKYCADKKNKEETLTEKEIDCYKHCTHRYLDIKTLIKNNLKAQYLDTTFDH